MPNYGARNTLIRLCNCYDMDATHNHIPWFKTRESQSRFFAGRTTHILEDNSYRKKYNSLKVDKSIEELNNVNYVVVQNQTGETYYYFITEKAVLGERVTQLVLKLDVMQTYMFDFKLEESLIEREHRRRWGYASDGRRLPIFSAIEEGLEVGEYELKAIHTIYDYSNKGTYFITSGDMLGISDDPRPTEPDGGGGGGDSENFRNGYADKNGLKFIKSVEGYARVPYNIGDGTNTTGYGITEVYQRPYYDRLIPECTEQEASVALGEVMYNFSGQVYNNLKSESYNFNNMTQGLFNAMTSLAYNSGVGGLMGTQVWDMILANDSKEAIAERWKTTIIMEGTEFEEGLRARRLKESQMILGTFDYNSLVISNVTDGGTVSGYGYIPKEYE